MAAAANDAMTTPTMAPVLRPDFVPCGNTGKIEWEQVSPLSSRLATIIEIQMDLQEYAENIGL